MHPEILRLITAQRGREMRAQASRARLARMARSARRGRNLPAEADEFVLPPIPDYVDGSFRTESAAAGSVDGPAAGGTGPAPAAQRAA